ncbi:MAG: methylenetetrahydrofolate reductase [Bacteroidales bacterium]|jgi:methylenetetrahydrofolate reductase (NADPH)|nr:methylenetetrahydrofolate reductase [Bacteroidales bacterium]
MIDISLELVPQDEGYIRRQTAFIEQNIPQINYINFPDLMRFEVRAWEACRMIHSSPLTKIAHIRAIDFDPHKAFPHTDFFRENSIDKVLVIEGDKPQDMKRRIYPTSSIDFIRKLRQEMPELKIYAGFDPYRNNIRFEMEYLMQKIAAGADGFFSQPFFDLRLLEIYAEYLSGIDVFWGISPVVSEKSRAYWETRNSAIFPKAFVPTIEWNINFGKQVLDFCRRQQFNLYLMPIRIDLEAYLKGLFDTLTTR